jgi:nucleoside-diphosphate-sugar epimerase
MTTLCITGIGGFIGLAMSKRALSLGWQVQGMDISEPAAARARALGIRVIVGDINDVDAVSSAASNADVVFHTAAIVEEDGAREDYERVNVEGTRTVCEAARTVGVKRVVHLSSVMVFGFDYLPEISEDGLLDGQGNVYNDSKLASEQVAMSFNDPEHGFGVIVIRPGDVYGLGSVPWVIRPIELLKQGVFMLPDHGRGVINHVHVENLIDGVLLAIQHDACGEAFTITDGLATPSRVFFKTHALIAGTRLPTAPTWVLKALLSALGPAYRALGKKPPASPEAMKFLLRKHRYSIAKAQRLLGYAPRIRLSEGMAELLADAQLNPSKPAEKPKPILKGYK